MPDSPIKQQDVFIAHGEAEQDVAERLRQHLPLARLRVAPNSHVSLEQVAACRAVVALQSRRKPDEAVRAAMALAQQNDQPVITAYVQGDQLALEQTNDGYLYGSYGQGVVGLVYKLWDLFETETDEVDNPLETGEDPLAWLARLAQHHHTTTPTHDS